MKFCKKTVSFGQYNKTFRFYILLPYFGKMAHEPISPEQVAANSTY